MVLEDQLEKQLEEERDLEKYLDASEEAVQLMKHDNENLTFAIESVMTWLIHEIGSVRSHAMIEALKHHSD